MYWHHSLLMSYTRKHALDTKEQHLAVSKRLLKNYKQKTITLENFKYVVA